MIFGNVEDDVAAGVIEDTWFGLGILELYLRLVGYHGNWECVLPTFI